MSLAALTWFLALSINGWASCLASAAVESRLDFMDLKDDTIFSPAELASEETRFSADLRCSEARL